MHHLFQLRLDALRIVVLVAASLILSLGERPPAQASDTDAKRMSFRSALRLQGRDHDVEIVGSRREIRVDTQGGADVAQFRLLEVLTQPTADGLGRLRRIWWALSLVPGDDVVQGETVFAVGATAREGSPLLVVAMGNTYYATTSIVLIDPLREVTEVPSRIPPAVDEQNPQALASRLVAESQVARIEVPPDLRGRLYGTKTLEVTSDGGSVHLRIEQADASITRLRYDLASKTWTKPSQE